MVNEQEEYDGQEEGEYHFSDEQITDETTEAVATPEEKKSSFQSSLLEKLGSKRRFIIGGVGLLILLFLVYKMLMPAAKPPSTEIAQVKPMSATPLETKKEPTPAGMLPQVPISVTEVDAPTGSQVMPTATNPAAPPMMQVQVSGSPQGQPPMMPPQQPAAGVSKEVMDKLAALEQNMQVAAASETEYSQKMSSYEEKSTALQSRVEELNTRIASMESSLNQLTKLLKEGTEQRASAPSAPSGARVSDTKVTYTVQAIIPGRAWLKSESGETVTVAEGDTIKDVGRVSKIDPYDGIVEIDVGNKIIALTYGGNAE
jgi:hypothetical protein